MHIRQAVDYLPLSLVDARFICVQYSTLGAFVKGFPRFYCHFGSQTHKAEWTVDPEPLQRLCGLLNHLGVLF